MALIFALKKEEKKVKTAKGSFDFKLWYQKNKKSLSLKRKKKYLEDASYRAAALQRSRDQRALKTPSVDYHKDPEGYSIQLSEAAEKLDISIWVLREWRKKDYFPEPRLRGGRLWFKESQVSLLFRLKNFFITHGSRTAAAHRDSLNNLVSLIWANWI